MIHSAQFSSRTFPGPSMPWPRNQSKFALPVILQSLNVPRVLWFSVSGTAGHQLQSPHLTIHPAPCKELKKKVISKLIYDSKLLLAFIMSGFDSGTSCLSLPGKPVHHMNVIVNFEESK